MILVAKTLHQAELLAKFLHQYAGVKPSPELAMVGWASNPEEQIDMVVGLDTFIGKTCHIHVAMREGFNYTPKAMLEAVFNFAFNQANIGLLIGVVNSLHERTLKYDKHLGFEELFRIPQMHNDGGDVVILGMRKEDCKYLKMKEAA